MEDLLPSITKQRRLRHQTQLWCVQARLTSSSFHFGMRNKSDFCFPLNKFIYFLHSYYYTAECVCVCVCMCLWHLKIPIPLSYSVCIVFCIHMCSIKAQTAAIEKHELFHFSCLCSCVSLKILSIHTHTHTHTNTHTHTHTVKGHDNQKQ